MSDRAYDTYKAYLVGNSNNAAMRKFFAQSLRDILKGVIKFGECHSMHDLYSACGETQIIIDTLQWRLHYNFKGSMTIQHISKTRMEFLEFAAIIANKHAEICHAIAHLLPQPIAEEIALNVCLYYEFVSGTLFAN